MILPERKALPPEDVSGADEQPDTFNEDVIKAAPTLSSDLGNDITSLLKDLTSGNTSAAQVDVSKVQAELQTQDASSVANAQTGSPLDSLIGKDQTRLIPAASTGDSQDGARHIYRVVVKTDRVRGSLINTSA